MELFEHDIDRLADLLEIQNKIQAVSPIFDGHYPVALVNNGVFEVFDVPDKNNGYAFITSAPCPFPIPQGVRAAFPLECYDEKTSAIISPDAFDTQEGYVFILHEFVHCAQSMDCENVLKDSLTIAQEYRRKNDYMWEINHPFPYDDPAFARLFQRYMDVLSIPDHHEAARTKHQLGDALSKVDFEYLLWQEWKEGFARFLENKIRNRLGMEENHYGSEMPFSRISFYESGSRFIAALERENPCVVNDMNSLFCEMAKYM